MASETQPLSRRRSGVLLHLSSLPGPGLGGTLGSAAEHFIEFLVAGGFSVWQVLPLGPPHHDRSPYLAQSAFALDPALLSLEQMYADGWLDQRIDEGTSTIAGRRALRDAVLRAAPHLAGEFDAFRSRAAHWLTDYAMFCVIRNTVAGIPWWQWPEPLRDRDDDALRKIGAENAAALEEVAFEQFLLDAQWRRLRSRAGERGVELFGDLPLFVAQDSADVWANRSLFKLDEWGQPQVVAGVPPDYFSATGQRWGNPQYDWEVHRKTGFEWWTRRVAHEIDRFDLLRIDHFRGLDAVWEIPAESDTALQGCWVQVPGEALLSSLKRSLGPLPLVAEDLGLISAAVLRLRDDFHLPGMRILQFAFDGGAANPYLPHNLVPDSVVYTGTHDNDTLRGWWESLAPHQQQNVADYLGCGLGRLPQELVRTAFASVSLLSIVPMQDLLDLGADARMNLPGMAEGNWRWRFTWDQVPSDLSAQSLVLNTRYGRF
jgi:4-alpha-glucanotransferase